MRLKVLQGKPRLVDYEHFTRGIRGNPNPTGLNRSRHWIAAVTYAQARESATANGAVVKYRTPR